MSPKDELKDDKIIDDVNEDAEVDEFDDEWDKLTSSTDDDDDLETAAGDDDDDDDPDAAALHTGDDTGAEAGAAAAAADDGGEPESLEEKYERLKAEHEDLQHKHESEKGRAMGLHDKLRDLRVKAGNRPTQTQVQKAMSSPEAWKAFEKDYPEMSKAINDRLGALRVEITNDVKRDVQAVIQPLNIAESNRRRNQETQALQEEHPDWEAISSSREFADWVDGKPDQVKSLVMSENAKDAAFLISTYKLETGILSKGDNGDGKDKEEEAEAAKLRAKREAQKKAGRALTTSSKMDRSGEADTGGDFDAAFAAHAKKKDKQLRNIGRL